VAALLNERAAWMTPTPEIQALHDRSLLVEQDGDNKTPGFLRVSSADPAGADAGKCSVLFWQTWVEGDNTWANASEPIPTGQSRSWQRYLSPDAVKLIEKNPDGPQFGELRLVLPPE
jgi:hypothetical protein